RIPNCSGLSATRPGAGSSPAQRTSSTRTARRRRCPHRCGPIWPDWRWPSTSRTFCSAVSACSSYNSRIVLMTFRLSLRNKLIYTFLAGSLLTVALFGVVIKGIMNDYFQRLAEARHNFVTEQGEREVRTNVAIYNEAFQNIFTSVTTSV